MLDIGHGVVADTHGLGLQGRRKEEAREGQGGERGGAGRGRGGLGDGEGGACCRAHASDMAVVFVHDMFHTVERPQLDGYYVRAHTFNLGRVVVLPGRAQVNALVELPSLSWKPGRARTTDLVEFSFNLITHVKMPWWSFLDTAVEHTHLAW
eukprot:4265635-Pleurochrysis_carterae.AAC.1